MGRHRRYVIGLAILVVLIGAYAVAGFLGVPYFARKSMQDFVRTHYGRALALGEIHFNPFTLNVELNKVALPDADGQPMLTLERLSVDLQWASLWRLGPSFGTIFLERPYVRAVIRRDGAVNLSDLGKGFAPAQPQKKSAPLRCRPRHRHRRVCGRDRAGAARRGRDRERRVRDGRHLRAECGIARG